ncbi:hypothetical protein [Aureimonas leprariae]|uniref:Uncharacterized protein n=1 Tax=Plantimonas leprariae TaxID=2615207 RepID=A0A7V7U1X6_9HYPH|nr:hypothetical protein [Aureimonas leprariae]KAB0682763.1 hypothetical protein F6X38_01385 [Aureimonas leprariae]
MDRMNGLDRFARSQRRWLGGLDMLDRPWYVLGGAPQPTLYPELARSYARVDINNSGLTADRLGLGPADLTIRRAKVNWTVHPTLSTHGLIWFTRTPASLLRLRLATKHRRVTAGSVMRIAKPDRFKVVAAVIGAEVRSVGSHGYPSNGIVAACYGLYFGVPEIVLTGVSLARQGHSYDTLNRPRRQVEEDTFALARLAGNARVATTEPELADATGMRLWTP